MDNLFDTSRVGRGSVGVGEEWREDWLEGTGKYVRKRQKLAETFGA